MKSDQDLYKRLRDLSKEALWSNEVSRFNTASQRERMENVAVIRAVGMIFSRFGTEEEKAQVRQWLISLLQDPQEKVRRYALAALPKIGIGESGEQEMLNLLGKSGEDREKRHVGRALEKVGGKATLNVIEESGGAIVPGITGLKVKAAVSRRENPGSLRMEALLSGDPDMRVLLRCRKGLEDFVREEAREILSPAEWIIERTQPGCVTLKPLGDFSLATLYRLRCFATVAFPLGMVAVGSGSNASWVEPLARCIASNRAREIMTAATAGEPRYRLEFAGRGHQRGAVRQVVDRAYALSPSILNDSRQSLWSVDVIPETSSSTPSGRGESMVELRPRLYPDPRLGYRQDDIAAASHPPLAACMVRLAGVKPDEIVWDPFCGSGLELVERSLRGGVVMAYGTDLDAKAIAVARENFDAARRDNPRMGGARAEMVECDFRDAATKAGISAGSISLMITNPPLGRRVRIKDMQGLFSDLYAAASCALKVGGRLVFVNPLRTGPSDPSLKLEFQKTVDLGGFNCRLEMYRKVIPGKQVTLARGGKGDRKAATNPKEQQSAGSDKSSSPKMPAPAWWSRVGNKGRDWDRERRSRS